MEFITIGNYSDQMLLQTISGYDSLVTLNLTINNSSTGLDNQIWYSYTCWLQYVYY